MIKEVNITAETIEEAEKMAREQLGREDIETEVIQQPEKKKFGLFGGNPAIIRAYVKLSPLESAKEYVTDILTKMGISGFEINAEETENGAVIDIGGEDVGFIIGHRGETLDALQYLTGLVANHVDNEYYRISINIGNYREKREKTLEILGRKLAFKAIKTGKKTGLEPMNPYERRIIHTAVQKVNGAISWSEGENAARHVVIGPDPKAKNNRKGGYNNNRRGGRRGGYNSNNRKSHTAPVNPDRVPLNEGGETGLYGRLDKK